MSPGCRAITALLALSFAGACDAPPDTVAGGHGEAGFGQGGFSGNSPWAGRDATFAGDAASGGDAPGDAAAVDAAIFNCPEVPTAYVFERSDPYTTVVGDATQLLTAAGFTVQPLPLDRDPRELRGLIFLGSFVSETAEYKDWVARYPTAIYTFVDAANVLIQMSQADQTEERPPFLPNAQSARRTDVDVGALVALDAEHPLLAEVPMDASGNLTGGFGYINPLSSGTPRNGQVVLRFQF